MYDVLAMNVYVTRLCKTTKQSIKQYLSCTTPKIHRETIATKIWQQISHSQEICKNDLHSSNPTPVAPKGEVLLTKNYCAHAKSEE